jgi:hypothetical protein
VHRASSKLFRCDVVSEEVAVSLRRRWSLLANRDLHVHRSGTDRRCVDTTEPLRPLTLDLVNLVSAEIAARECERRE